MTSAELAIQMNDLLDDEDSTDEELQALQDRLDAAYAVEAALRRRE